MGKHKYSKDGIVDEASLATSIIVTICLSTNGRAMELQPLRTTVLTTPDISSEKVFKLAIKQLDKDERGTLSEYGTVKLSKLEHAKGDEEEGNKSGEIE